MVGLNKKYKKEQNESEEKYYERHWTVAAGGNLMCKSENKSNISEGTIETQQERDAQS